VAKKLPGMFGETEKQIKLQRREADDPIANGDAMLSLVNAKVSYNQNTLCAESVGGMAPELNANSGTQLTEAEGCCDVVISTSVEGFNLSVFVHAVREHNNGNLRDFSKLPTEFNTVHLRHRDICDNEIWLPFLSGDHALNSVCRNMRQVTLGRESRSEHICGLGLVVDDEDLRDAGTLAITLTHGCTELRRGIVVDLLTTDSFHESNYHAAGPSLGSPLRVAGLEFKPKCDLACSVTRIFCRLCGRKHAKRGLITYVRRWRSKVGTV
jgi:hypothetical protein